MTLILKFNPIFVVNALEFSDKALLLLSDGSIGNIVFDMIIYHYQVWEIPFPMLGNDVFNTGKRIIDKTL